MHISEILKAWSLRAIVLWQMESNALLKSINSTPTILFLSSSCLHISVRCSIRSSVDLFGLKPRCFLLDSSFVYKVTVNVIPYNTLEYFAWSAQQWNGSEVAPLQTVSFLGTAFTLLIFHWKGYFEGFRPSPMT